jgi:hypothetical protein
MVTIKRMRAEDIPGWEEDRPLREQHDRDSNYLNTHLSELRKLYPDELVAIFQEKVIAHGKTLDEFGEALDKVRPESGYPVVFFVSQTPITLIV